jgi:predicted signal transduction protein with EAL and GGDEF domain
MSADPPAQLAKAALRRLTLDKLEPTPDNYARAYQLEQGGAPPAALPDTPVDEGRLILTRLQRSLTGGLFMHENQQIFVTFSAGVTGHCPGEPIEDALQRADLALYQAKRAGKNRTFIG